MRDGMVVRNVASLVKRPSQTKRVMNIWTADQAAAFHGFDVTIELAP